LQNATLAQFADDVAILQVDDSFEEATTKTQSALDSTSAWCSKWRVQMNSSKSIVIPFTKKRAEFQDTLHISGNPIPQDTKLRESFGEEKNKKLSSLSKISATTDLQDLAEIELARVLSAEGWYQRELTFLANLSLNTLAAEANVQRKRHTGRHHHITAQNSSKKGHTSGESRTRNLSKQIEEKPTQEKEMKEPEMKDIYEIWSKPYGWLVLPGEKMPMIEDSFPCS
ncbi:hypothetical protein GE061_012991, partial [Apolygus lucorum]